MKPIFCISGVTGQDGSYAAEILLLSNIKVIGLSRNNKKKYKNLFNCQNNENFIFLETDYSESSINDLLNKYKITNIINFCGQSYVSRSWETIEETIVSQSIIVSRFLNIISNIPWDIKLVNAGSSEMFGESIEKRHESSIKAPYNPYGCAQLLAYSLINSFRNNQKLWISTAILFPHESLRRSSDFLFMQILNQIDQIILSKNKKISIGNPFVVRDWGCAPEYVYYMILMMMMESPEDLCIATGAGISVKEFVNLICLEYDLNLENIMHLEAKLTRRYEPFSVIGNNQRMLYKLKVEAPLSEKKMIKKIISIKKNCVKNNINLDKVTDYLSSDKIKFIKENSDKFLIKKP